MEIDLLAPEAGAATDAATDFVDLSETLVDDFGDEVGGVDVAPFFVWRAESITWALLSLPRWEMSWSLSLTGCMSASIMKSSFTTGRDTFGPAFLYRNNKVVIGTRPASTPGDRCSIPLHGD